MASNVSLFAQIVHLVPRDLFKDIVGRHQADKHAKGCCSWTQLIALLYAQIGQADSLRDIEGGLRAVGGRLSHVGLKHPPSKSALAYQNQRRSWMVFKDLYLTLHAHLIGQHAPLPPGVKALFALDSTTVPLCLELYPWAKFRAAKGAIKLHTLLNLRDCLPAYVIMSEARAHDASKMAAMPVPKGSVVVADRGYLSSHQMYAWHCNEVKFVIRSRENVGLTTQERPAPKGGHTGNVVHDWNVTFTGQKANQAYPEPLRMVQVQDEQGHYLELLTNETSWTAAQVADLYRQRWQIEIFFKELKQHLCIKSFLGTSENAVLSQVWSAMIAILLVKYLRKKAQVKWHFSNLIAFLRLHLFNKVDLWLWLAKPYKDHNPPPDSESSQLSIGFG